MKSSVYSCLFMKSLIILCSCATVPAASPSQPKTAMPEATQPITAPAVSEEAPAPTEPAPTEAAPAPKPTEMPVLPCNISFDSDRDGNLEIYSMDPDGSNQVNLTNNLAEDFDAVWSPDGSFVAFVSNRESEAGGGYFIYTMKADGSEADQVSSEPESRYPDCSPLGNQIAYSSKGDVYLVEVGEGTEVNLTNSPEHDEQHKFSQDGKRIAWLRGETSDLQIFIMDLDSKKGQQVTKGGTVFDIEWTMDGRLFAY